MTPAEIAKHRLAAESRSSRDLAEKLVSKYTARLMILNAKKERGELAPHEKQERDDLRSLVVVLG